jgi:hypothetical protein
VRWKSQARHNIQLLVLLSAPDQQIQLLTAFCTRGKGFSMFGETSTPADTDVGGVGAKATVERRMTKIK